MNFFFPDTGWLCTAENCTQTMHNLVPIRGALVRDALRWSTCIGELLELVGERVELSFASHHWPRWGTDEVVSYLTLQRDLYRWIHDQTMRWANHGLTALEIAEQLVLPPEFAAQAHTTGYYGDLVHNVKAVYQRYLSWYDANPAHLWSLPPIESGRRYVELAGGPDALLASARRSFEDGDYRWVAEVVNHLVFADPGNDEARHLQADALEQLGYQSCSATFRNAFLTGAQELRTGTLPPGPARASGYVAGMTVGQLFESVAVRLRSEDVGGLDVLVNWTVTDLDERWVLGLSNRTLHAVQGRHDRDAAVGLTLARAALQDLVTGEATLADLVAAGTVTVDGDLAAAGAVFDHLDTFLTFFPVVTP
jgi:alkyl sulfatase BDS1-like metallo-beta-lactamase superfamily hydrolase